MTITIDFFDFSNHVSLLPRIERPLDRAKHYRRIGKSARNENRIQVFTDAVDNPVTERWAVERATVTGVV